LVTSLQQNAFGRTYASIDAVSKPTRKVVPSGSYDPAAARQRLAEWKAKQSVQMPASLPSSQLPAASFPTGSMPQPPCSMLPSATPASPAAPSPTLPAASFPPGSKPQAPCSTLPTPPADDDVPF
jgi:hypothetical protein